MLDEARYIIDFSKPLLAGLTARKALIHMIVLVIVISSTAILSIIGIASLFLLLPVLVGLVLLVVMGLVYIEARRSRSIVASSGLKLELYYKLVRSSSYKLHVAIRVIEAKQPIKLRLYLAAVCSYTITVSRLFVRYRSPLARAGGRTWFEKKILEAEVFENNSINATVSLKELVPQARVEKPAPEAFRISVATILVVEAVLVKGSERTVIHAFVPIAFNPAIHFESPIKLGGLRGYFRITANGITLDAGLPEFFRGKELELRIVYRIKMEGRIVSESSTLLSKLPLKPPGQVRLEVPLSRLSERIGGYRRPRISSHVKPVVGLGPARGAAKLFALLYPSLVLGASPLLVGLRCGEIEVETLYTITVWGAYGRKEESIIAPSYPLEE